MKKYIITSNNEYHSEVYSDREDLSEYFDALNTAPDRILITNHIGISNNGEENITFPEIRERYKHDPNPYNTKIWANTLYLNGQCTSVDDFPIVIQAGTVLTSTALSQWQDQYITHEIREQWLDDLKSPHEFLSK